MCTLYTSTAVNASGWCAEKRPFPSVGKAFFTIKLFKSCQFWFTAICNFNESPAATFTSIKRLAIDWEAKKTNRFPYRRTQKTIENSLNSLSVLSFFVFSYHRILSLQHSSTIFCWYSTTFSITTTQTEVYTFFFFPSRPTKSISIFRFINNHKSHCGDLMLCDLIYWTRPLQASFAPRKTQNFISISFTRFRLNGEQNRIVETTNLLPAFPPRGFEK